MPTTATARRGTDLSTWLSQTRAFTDRYARELFRNRTVLFWTVAFPAAFYLLTVSLFLPTGQIPAEILPYVKAGTAVTYGTFGAIIASLNSFGQQLAMDFEDDRYALYRSMPVAPSADLAGRMVAGVTLAAVAMAVVIAVAAATGARFGLDTPAAVPVVLVAFGAFAAFWMVVAVVVATAVRDTRYASIITVSLALGLYFLTGYNGGDPTAFQGPGWLLNWLPNTLPTRLIADAIASAPPELAQSGGPGAPDPWVGAATMAVYGVGALAVGALIMRRMVYDRGLSL